jgi:glycosyltransferase involved in cell wall biosynthesis
LKILDYHSVGRPVIASRSPSYQYIEDKKFGVLVEIDDDIDIIQGLKSVINDREKWLNLAKISNDYVRNEKTWEKTVERVENELIKVISL